MSDSRWHRRNGSGCSGGSRTNRDAQTRLSHHGEAQVGVPHDFNRYQVTDGDSVGGNDSDSDKIRTALGRGRTSPPEKTQLSSMMSHENKHDKTMALELY